MFSVLRRSPLSKRGSARPKNLDRIVRHILNQSQESQRHNVERLKGLREIMARNWISTRSMDRNGPYVDTADDVNNDTPVIASDEVATQSLAGNEIDVAAKPPTLTAPGDNQLASSAEAQSNSSAQNDITSSSSLSSSPDSSGSSPSITVDAARSQRCPFHGIWAS